MPALASSLLILAVSAAAPPEDTAPLRLTLDQARARAVEASARLGQLRALEQSSEAGLRGARAGRLPQLDLTAGYTRQSHVPEFSVVLPGAGVLPVFPDIPDNWRARAALGLPLYTGGRLTAAIEAARRQLEASGKDTEAARADLRLETAVAFWVLVNGRESVRVLSEGLAAYDQHLQDAKNRVEQGLAATNELLAVQVERDRAELQRLQAQSAARAAEANLQRLLDLPATTGIEPVPGEPVASPPAPDREALARAALLARPELEAVRARQQAAEAAVRVQRAARLPQATLFGGFDYARPNPRILPQTDSWNDTWSVGLSVGFTAFDGGRTSAASAQAQAQAEAVRQQALDLERRVRLEVAQRVLDVETAAAARGVAQQGLASARENVRVARDRFREGLIPSSELLDAETNLLRAGLSLTEAENGLRLALDGLDRAVGR